MSVTDTRPSQLPHTVTDSGLAELAPGSDEPNGFTALMDLLDDPTTRADTIDLLIGEPPDPTAVSRAASAAYYGTTCGTCANTLEPDQPAYRCRYNFRHTGGLISDLYDQRCYATTCKDCYSSDLFLYLAGGDDELVSECFSCLRPLIVGGYRANQRWVACSTTCLAALRREDRRQKRTTTTCSTCGETFTPARSDARYCSSACRQRGYRQRKGTT